MDMWKKSTIYLFTNLLVEPMQEFQLLLWQIDPTSLSWLFLTDKNRLCVARLLFHISPPRGLRVICKLLFLLSWPLRPYLSDRLGQWNIHWSPAQETVSLELKLNLDTLICLKMVSGGASPPYGAPKMDSVCVNGTARVAETQPCWYIPLPSHPDCGWCVLTVMSSDCCFPLYVPRHPPTVTHKTHESCRGCGFSSLKHTMKRSEAAETRSKRMLRITSFSDFCTFAQPRCCFWLTPSRRVKSCLKS